MNVKKETLATLIKRFKSTRLLEIRNLEDPNKRGFIRLISKKIIIPKFLLEQEDPYTDIHFYYKDKHEYPIFHIEYPMFGIKIKQQVDIDKSITEFTIIGTNDQIGKAIKYLIEITTTINMDQILDYNKHREVTNTVLRTLLKEKDLKCGQVFSVPTIGRLRLPSNYNNLLNGIFGMINQVSNYPNIKLVRCSENTIDFVKS